uniref:Uncharacterized protein n=1 Tax=Chromera velia CCMP2878 TaxID=1169474 RepID=A0A0G4FB59_9ALVE|eukprot:Cvel_16017.t1-p1 / transcript=Cvel_16017.t1 / gene=Cvel_16017 / organism=Chromera_velia_CCMP2878 / gene_product=hypothetical protein / transcript_product=hypothetical protein / location=Cvel_scaffold1215:36904-43208(-) / protein_length=1187 / sequence_SO=supercontig / SO=protein_coding / is_pseudo=false
MAYPLEKIQSICRPFKTKSGAALETARRQVAPLAVQVPTLIPMVAKDKSADAIGFALKDLAEIGYAHVEGERREWGSGKEGGRDFWFKCGDAIMASDALSKMTALGVSLTASAFAQTETQHRPLFSALAKHLVGDLSLVSSKVLAHSVNALAAARKKVTTDGDGAVEETDVEFVRSQVMGRLGNVSETSSMNMEELTRVATSLGNLTGTGAGELSDADREMLQKNVSGRVLAIFSSFNDVSLAALCNAYAKLGIKDVALFRLLSSLTASKLRAFSPQGIALCANAYAKLGFRSRLLFEALEIEGTRRMNEFDVPAIVTLLNAFARQDTSAPRLFLEAARVIPAAAERDHRRGKRLKPQDIGIALNAFGKFPEIFKGSAERRSLGRACVGFFVDRLDTRRSLSDFLSQNIANSLNGLAKLDARVPPRVLNRLAEEMTARMKERRVTAADVMQASNAFARFRHFHEDFILETCRHLPLVAEQGCKPFELSIIMHGLGVLASISPECLPADRGDGKESTQDCDENNWETKGSGHELSVFPDPIRGARSEPSDTQKDGGRGATNLEKSTGEVTKAVWDAFEKVALLLVSGGSRTGRAKWLTGRGDENESESASLVPCSSSTRTRVKRFGLHDFSCQAVTQLFLALSLSHCRRAAVILYPGLAESLEGRIWKCETVWISTILSGFARFSIQPPERFLGALVKAPVHTEGNRSVGRPVEGSAEKERGELHERGDVGGAPGFETSGVSGSSAPVRASSSSDAPPFCAPIVALLRGAGGRSLSSFLHAAARLDLWARGAPQGLLAVAPLCCQRILDGMPWPLQSATPAGMKADGISGDRWSISGAALSAASLAALAASRRALPATLGVWPVAMTSLFAFLDRETAPESGSREFTPLDGRQIWFALSVSQMSWGVGSPVLSLEALFSIHRVCLRVDPEKAVVGDQQALHERLSEKIDLLSRERKRGEEGAFGEVDREESKTLRLGEIVADVRATTQRQIEWEQSDEVTRDCFETLSVCEESEKAGIFLLSTVVKKKSGPRQGRTGTASLLRLSEGEMEDSNDPPRFEKTPSKRAKHMRKQNVSIQHTDHESSSGGSSTPSVSGVVENLTTDPPDTLKESLRGVFRNPLDPPASGSNFSTAASDVDLYHEEKCPPLHQRKSEMLLDSAPFASRSNSKRRNVGTSYKKPALQTIQGVT